MDAVVAQHSAGVCLCGSVSARNGALCVSVCSGVQGLSETLKSNITSQTGSVGPVSKLQHWQKYNIPCACVGCAPAGTGL